ncbi:2-hydroxyacid dehydrogenase [Haloglycomyces albus]|uniref:2-hydroxyacid dehydrogenase n=1 Tax=Haloglycomyces albus TaxID=526067 RepID=UPI00046CA721|nr:2-hydroxyacid dehydrogenase [Haloglycomyces albus]
MLVWIPHGKGRRYLGDLPSDVTVETFTGESFPSDPAGVDFWVPPFLAGKDVPNILKRMPGLRVIQLLSAGADVWVGRTPDGVTLCDARGTHTAVTTEWTVAAVLSSLRRFDTFIRRQERHVWKPQLTPTVTRKNALIVGAGDIGEHVARTLETLDVSITKVARRARPGVHSIDHIDELLPQADVVILNVPLTDATRHLADADFLARMKDGALLVNAARGPVVDTDALVEEVKTGRLRAALDVTDPEPLPEGHPLWDLDGVIITPHVGGSTDDLVEREYVRVGDQIRRYAEGEPLINIVTGDY